MTKAQDSESVLVTRPSAHVAVLQIVEKPLGVLRIAAKRAISRALSELEADPTVRCVILTGTGNAFSVGSDIREFQRDRGWLLGAEEAENALNDQIEAARFAVIAAINAAALGGGAVLALACDIRIAGRSARIGLPEVKVGAFASGSGTQRLPRLIGRGRALLLLMTGRIIEAAEAERIGLIEQVVEDDHLMTAALSVAAEIATMPPNAVAASKRCVNEGLRYGWQAGMQREAVNVVELGMSDEAVEGQRAFIEKRPPRFAV
jgi:enoyl-CoA hydratase/carnithine racemase